MKTPPKVNKKKKVLLTTWLEFHISHSSFFVVALLMLFFFCLQFFCHLIGTPPQRPREGLRRRRHCYSGLRDACSSPRRLFCFSCHLRGHGSCRASYLAELAQLPLPSLSRVGRLSMRQVTGVDTDAICDWMRQLLTQAFICVGSFHRPAWEARRSQPWDAQQPVKGMTATREWSCCPLLPSIRIVERSGC